MMTQHIDRHRRSVPLHLPEDVAEWLLEKLAAESDPQAPRVTARLAESLRETQKPRRPEIALSK